MTDLLTPQIREAIKRSLQLALAAFALTFVSLYVKNGDAKSAASAGAAAAAVALFGRGGVEGLYDSRRAATGNVLPGDVTAAPTR